MNNLLNSNKFLETLVKNALLKIVNFCRPIVSLRVKTTHPIFSPPLSCQVPSLFEIFPTLLLNF